jgi:hypothetical protein
MANITQAILSINPSAEVVVRGTDIDTCTIEWLNNTPEISKDDIKAKINEVSYIDKRLAQYPTIEELVVALYDTEDKAAIEAKRAEVKAKYPK